MEMIPVAEGYSFKSVVVDSVHVNPKGGKMRREDIMYKPHIAEYNSAEIVLIPRDRDISNTQESGFDPTLSGLSMKSCNADRAM